MTPEIVTRSFSNDQFVFDNTFFDNCYKLKGNKDKNKVFVDIGAHAGYFAFAALSLGAKKVYCIEPYIDNFNMLLKNCYNPNFIGRVTPYQLGVYTSPIIGKFSSPELIDGIYFDLSSVGLRTKNDDESYYSCHCTTLNSVLDFFCYGEKIDVLKINIGYAEKEILLSSESLVANVEAICGMVTCDDPEFLEFKKQMGVKGFINCISKPANEKGRVLFWMSKNSLSENFIN